MRQIRLRGAWLRDLWATLAGSPHPVVTEVDFETPNWLEIAPDDGLIAYLEQHPDPLAAGTRDLPSLGVAYLAANHVSLLVPLATRGRLVGLLSLGEPGSGGVYSAEDLVFLTTLADEAAAAVRIAQLLANGPGHKPPSSVPATVPHQ